MITIHLNTISSVPLYEQIYLHIKSEIQNGSLVYGSKLPSARGFAAHLQVSRNTIDMAYGQLLSEGYIESKEKKGYYVSQVLELAHFTPDPIKKTTTVQEECKTYQYDFSPFSIDSRNFPYNTWRKLSKNCLNNDSNLILLGSGQGDQRLRNAVTGYLHESRGVHCTPEQIIIGAGADYLLQLLLQLLPSDTVIAMENPSYKQAFRIFHGLHYKTLPIDLDPYGMNIDNLTLSSANIAYVTPSHQYPLGIVMPVKRRFELLNWANLSKERYIIEDDHDSEFRYKGRPIPALQGLDSNDKVIYLGTFSRAIAPAIRIGYVVLPKELLDRYQQQFSYYSSTVSRVDQGIVTAFLEDGHFERHLNRMRKIYKNKHDLMIQSLKIFKNGLKIYGENAGLHLVIELHTKLTEDAVALLAEHAKIKLYGITEHYIKPPDFSPFPAFLLGYANMTEEDIKKGINQLYSVLMPYLY